jgi:hypothetical protein
MAQLGTDSLPANRGKLNLNYDNVNNSDPQVPGFIDPSLTTSLVPWTPIRFFTNAADLMLRSQSSTILGVSATNVTLSVTNIPIYPANFYVASVHRLLQLAANILDATTTNRFPGTNSLYAPSVFRPLFGTDGRNIFISGYEEVTNNASIVLAQRWLNLNVPTNAPAAGALISAVANNPRVNVYGIPYVIGAKKGFPNFNELLLQTSVQVTRRMEVVRNSAAETPVFHQSYEIGVTNYLAMEAWNSYTQAFPRALQMFVTNSTWLAFSNATPNAIYLTNKSILTTTSATLPPNDWKGQEFRVPLSNSVVFIPNSEFNFNPTRLEVLRENVSFDRSQGFPVPDWKLNITNRLQFVLVDSESRRIVDFVNLDRVTGGMDIMRELVTLA